MNTLFNLEVEKAKFSPCQQYRYTLWRRWGTGGYVNFICLNPSTADDQKDDNTIRKCVKFAKSWGYDAMCVTNLFAYRSTDRSVLKHVTDPIGPDNDQTLIDIAAGARLIVAAWSQDGHLFGRSMWIRSMIHRPIHYLRMGTGKHPEPWHPLYLPDISRPIEWGSEVKNLRSEGA